MRRHVVEILASVVLQFGISWESVFDILADQSGNIWKAFIQWQLDRLVDNFVGKSGLFEILLRTPAPQMKGGGVIFGTPSQPIWSNLKTLYWNRFLPVGYLALFLSVMVSYFGKAWGFGAQKTKQRQFGLLIGLFLLPGGWYLSVAYLKLMNLFALGVLPNIGLLQDAATRSLADILGGDVTYAFVVGSMAILAFILALLVNLMRLVAIWMLVPTLPLILGFDLGEFPILGNFGRSAYTIFAVMAAVPIPIGIGTRIIYSFYQIAANGGDVFFTDAASTVYVLVIPSLMALVPLYVFAQAADYATIRASTAALSFIGKPVTLAAAAASGGTTTAASLAKNAIGGSNRDTDGDGGGPGAGPGDGGGGDAGPRPGFDHAQSDGTASSNGWGNLPTRKPSGARPATQGGPKSDPQSPPALPGQDTHRARASPGVSEPTADYVSDGETIEPQGDFSTYADREFARSQVLAKGRASTYHPGNRPLSESSRGGRAEGTGREDSSTTVVSREGEVESVEQASNRVAERTQHIREQTTWERDRRDAMNRRQRHNRDRYSNL